VKHSLRLATWNCCGGPLEKKLAAARALEADITVIPESPALPREDRHARWIGGTARKGLAVLSSPPFTLRRIPRRTPLPDHALPLIVEGPVTFLLIAVWMKGVGPDRYVRGMHRTIRECRALIRRYPTVVMGDFNANAIWDHQHPAHLSHSALVAELEDLGLVSAYHHVRGEAHGRERRPTFYFYRKRESTYHLDYCFLPRTWADQITRLEVGTWRRWHPLSDHVPVACDLGSALLSGRVRLRSPP